MDQPRFLSGQLHTLQFARLVVPKLLSIGVILVIASMASVVMPIPLNWMARLFMIGSLWGGISGVSSLWTTVAEYELAHGLLTYRLLARSRLYEIRLEDITDVSDKHSRFGVPSILVYVEDGTMLLLAATCLEGVSDLVQILSAQIPRQRTRLIGTFEIGQSAARFGSTIVARTFSVGLLLLGGLFTFAAVVAVQQNLAVRPHSLFLLGGVFALAGGFLFLLTFQSGREISWFELTDNEFRYRLGGWKRVYCLPLDAIVSVTDHHADVSVHTRGWASLYIAGEKRPLSIHGHVVSNVMPLIAHLQARLQPEEVRTPPSVEPNH